MNAARRIAIFALIILALMVALPGKRSSAQLAPLTAEHVTATPAEGTLLTRFSFFGSGFAPNRTVSVRLTIADGSERRFRTPEGIENVWLTRADGSFDLDFMPALRFPGAPAGHWQALFCGADAPTCQRVDLDIAP